MDDSSTNNSIVYAIKWGTKWLVLWAIGIGCVLLSVIGLIFAYETWSNRPVVSTEIEGVRLGDSLNDVKFRFEDVVAKKKNKNDTSSETDYEIPSKNLTFSLKNGGVSLISYRCGKNEAFQINGIKCGATSEEIIERYSKHSIKIECLLNSEENPELVNRLRTYEAIKFGVSYFLYLNSVVQISVMPVKELEKFESNRRHWGKCE